MRTREGHSRSETRSPTDDAGPRKDVPSSPAHPAATGSTLSLARSPYAVLDRFLPRRPWPFVGVVAAIALAFWLAGGLLAADRGRWLASREWQVQPLYLAVHLALVRAFVTSYAANFLAGCAHLRMDPATAKERVRHALGWRSIAVACAVAAPLVAFDVSWVTTESEVVAEVGLGVSGALGAADVLMVAIWSLEWVLNAYVWAIVVAFLVHTMRALGKHPFRAPIESVLRERHYRPLLLMNAQGASLTAVGPATHVVDAQTRGKQILAQCLDPEMLTWDGDRTDLHSWTLQAWMAARVAGGDAWFEKVLPLLEKGPDASGGGIL